MTLLRLAAADLWHERRLAFCTILAMAAVLAPLLVLAGLREGVIAGLREALLQDPRAREIVSAANRDLPAELLITLAGRPDVAFLVPRLRTLSASLPVQKAGGESIRLELIPTASGDPLLERIPDAADAVILSAAAAARLGASPGDRLTGRLLRLREGAREPVNLALRVAGIAPPRAFAREGAFVSLPLATYVEDYQDGRAPPLAPDQAIPQTQRVAYAGFRLYARRLELVPALDAALRGQGLEVVSRAGEVAGMLTLDSNLRLLLWLVAGLGGVGYLISLAAGLWATVERKRASLAMLRFLGLPARALALFPALQSVAMGVAGAALAWLAAEAVALLVNRAFAGTLGLDRALCRLTWTTGLVSLGLTVAGAAVAAAAAGWHISRVEPWEGMR